MRTDGPEPIEELRSEIYTRFREQPLPVIATDGQMIPAATLWVMVRHHVAQLRDEFPTAALVLTDSPSGTEVVVTVLSGLWLGVPVRFDLRGEPWTLRPSDVLFRRRETTSIAGRFETVPGPWTAREVVLGQVLPGLLRGAILIDQEIERRMAESSLSAVPTLPSAQQHCACA